MRTDAHPVESDVDTDIDESSHHERHESRRWDIGIAAPSADGDAILSGASYTFNGSNTYVHDAAGTVLVRPDGYDADTFGILFV